MHLIEIVFFLCNIMRVFCAKNVSVNSIIEKYVLFCGPDYVCEKASVGFQQVPLTYLHLDLCPACSCHKSCLFEMNCCPDIYFSLPHQSCENTVLVNTSPYKKTPDYAMVSECPFNTDQVSIARCLANRTVAENIALPPVTSTSDLLTYRNKYCASCNGQTQFTEWEISISCHLFADFNYISTFEEVIEYAKNKSCLLSHLPSIQGSLMAANCSLETAVTYDKCNITGAWEEYDPDIMHGCDSSYIAIYKKIFKNIFCYICNPMRLGTFDLIDSCNTTGVWEPYDSVLEDACKIKEKVRRRHPYKNVFCYLCNRNNTNNNHLQDVYLEHEITPGNGMYRIRPIGFNLQFYFSTTRLNSVNTSIRIDQNLPYNLTNILLHYYAWKVMPVGLCNSSLIPSEFYNVIKDTVLSCSCDPKSIFAGMVPPCIDITLASLTGYVSNVISFGNFYKTPEKFVHVIKGCSTSSANIHLKRRCEDNATDTFTFLYVQDKSTGIMYKNIDCYLCNTKYDDGTSFEALIEELEFPFDAILIDCGSLLYLDYYKHLSLFHLIEDAKESGCRLSFFTGLGGFCFMPGIVSSCNETGLWSKDDSDIDKVCSDSDKYSYFEQNGIGYNNIFCAMCSPSYRMTNTVNYCNESSPYYTPQNQIGCRLFPENVLHYPFKNIFCAKCYSTFGFPFEIDNECYREGICIYEPFLCACRGPGCVLPEDIPGVKFRNLFSLYETKNNYEDHDDTTCLVNFIYDAKKKICREMLCSPGKFIANGRCRALFRYTKNLRFSMNFKLTLYINFTIDKENAIYSTINTLPEWWQRLLRAEIGVEVVIISATAFSQGTCDETILRETFLEMSASINFIIVSYCDRLQVEKQLFAFQNDFGNLIFGMENASLSGNSTQYTANVTYSGLLADPPLIERGFNLHTEIVDINNTCQVCSMFTSLESNYTKYKSVAISRQLFCPYIEFKEEEYIYNASRKIITFINFNAVLHSDMVTFVQDTKSTVYACVDDILSTIDKTEYRKTNFEMVVDVLNIVCTCMSILCLLLSLVTYCLFPNLRTLPGRNNMCLISSLLIAQACFQFGSIWTNYIIVCKVVGTVLHMFWLSTFGCMFTCSFHMYIVFTSLKVLNKDEEKRKFYKYLCFNFGIPIVIVVTNVLVHLGIYGLENIGYGEEYCFISDLIPKVATFISPVGLVCIINIFLFIKTARTIHQRPTVRSTRDAQNDFVIYIKMFALTGITWLGQIIDGIFPLSVISLIVTLLTGLQGMFIFLSYVGNKRVLGMYRKKFCRKETTKQLSVISSKSLDSNTGTRTTGL